MAEVKVLLHDTATGDEGWDVHQVEPQYVETQEFWWTEGNAACDCNRLMFLHRALGKERPDKDGTDYPCGDSRVVIKAATIDGVPQDWA